MFPVSRRAVVVAAAAAVFGVVVFAWFSFGGLVKDRLGWLEVAREEGRAAVKDVKALEQEHASAQTAVRELSKQVMESTKAARAARAAAQKSEASARYWEGQAAQLQQRVGEIERDRRARPVIRSMTEARDALHGFGFTVR